MKKIIIVLFFLTLFIYSNKNQSDIVIPDSSIRFRIIANSNSNEDQYQKIAIKEKIENDVFKNLNQKNNINEFRQEIKANIPKIEKILEDSNIAYQINYGDNYFPLKEYKGVKYNAGIYESLVITLGTGQGKNWWCVLFPPLCLLESEQENLKDREYKSYIKEIITEYI